MLARFSRYLEKVCDSGLRTMLAKINHRLGRNKVFPKRWAMRFVAIDGHEFFSPADTAAVGRAIVARSWSTDAR